MTTICLYLIDTQPLDFQNSELENTKLYGQSEIVGRDNSIISVSKQNYELVHSFILSWLKVYPQLYINLSLSSKLLQIALDNRKKWKLFELLKQNEQVEFLAQALDQACMSGYTKEEFSDQISGYLDLLKKTTKNKAYLFHSKHLYFNNQMAKELDKLGLEGVVSSHSDLANMWQHPNFVYQSKSHGIKILIQNQTFSDDLARLISLNSPQRAGDFVSAIEDCGEVVNLFVDYNQILEGIDFLEELLLSVVLNPQTKFALASDVLTTQEAITELDTPNLFNKKIGKKIITSPLDLFFLRY